MKKSGFVATGPPLPQTQPPPWIQTSNEIWQMTLMILDINLKADYILRTINNHIHFDNISPWQAMMHFDWPPLLLEQGCQLSGRGNPRWAPTISIHPDLHYHGCTKEMISKSKQFRDGWAEINVPNHCPLFWSKFPSQFPRSWSSPPMVGHHAGDTQPSCCWNCPKHLISKTLAEK